MVKHYFTLGLVVLVLITLLTSCDCKLPGTTLRQNVSLASRIYAKSRLPGIFKTIYAKQGEEKEKKQLKQITNINTNLNALANINNNLVQAIQAIVNNVGVFNAVGVGVGLINLLAAKVSPGGFIGRCFGVARKLKIVIPFIIFKLGVIITTLAFLTLFSMKTLGIGIVLLIMNISKFLAKFIALKGHQHNSDAGVHYHIHSKEHHSPHYTHYPKIEEYYTDSHGWHDRIGERLSEVQTAAERKELLDLYRRLGMARNQERSFVRRRIF